MTIKQTNKIKNYKSGDLNWFSGFLNSKLILLFLLINNCLNYTGNAQTSYTFMPAGATGSAGPNQGMTNSTYSSTSLNGLVSTSLGIQSWTVPSTGNYSIQAYGANGGNSALNGYIGGYGALVSGQFSLTAGSVLKILVGQKGLVGTYNGYYPGGGGGGGSYVSSSSTLVISAAGGGGAGVGDGGTNGNNGNPGIITTTGNIANGWGSYPNGNPGSAGNGGTGGNYYSGGGGGGYSSNGTNFGSGTLGLGGYAFLNGGNGGAGGYYSGIFGGNGGFGGGAGAMYGGGGGGGYSGGAGGTHGGSSNATGGGGGGSFNSGTSQNNTSGINNGDGYVVITRLAGISISQSALVSCYGSLNAALTPSAFGGVGPYNFVWSNSAITSSIGGIGAGVYTCTVTDAVSAVYTSTYLVTQPSPLSSSVSALSNVTCYGGSNGFATVAGYGATAPYTYSWSSTGSTFATVSGLSAGSYSVIVKDANNCTTTSSINITQSVPLVIYAFVSSPTVCSGNSTTLVATGALTYTWSGGVFNGVGFNPTVGATYSVNGTDNNGCIGSTTLAISVNPSPTVSISGSSIVCSGSNLTLSASGAVSYTWNTGAITNTANIVPLTTTVISATGFNSLGCANTAIKTISVMSLPVITTTISNSNICAGAPAVLYAGGAITYTWAGGTTNGVAFYPVSTGVYVVSGTDINGCVNTATRALTVVPAPSLAISGNASICAGSISSLSVSGASSYTWNTGANSSNISASPSVTTIYSVTGINSGGCSGTAFYSVLVNSIPTLTVLNSNSQFCYGSAYTLLAGGSANSFTWLPGNITSSYLNIIPTVNATYTLVGASSAGCSSSTNILVSVAALPIISISSASSVCNGNSLSIIANGATSYTWSTGAISSSILVTPGVTTVYSLTGLGTNGCTSTATNVVTVDQTPVVTIQNINNSFCQGIPVGLLASGAASYTWIPGNVIGSLNYVTVNSTSGYSVIGLSASGCSNVAAYLLTVNPNPTVTISGNTILCKGAIGTFTANGATTYSWSNLSQGTTMSLSTPNNVTVSVNGTDNNGCIGSKTLAITIASLPTVNISGLGIVCEGDNLNLSATGANTYSWSNVNLRATAS